MKAQYDAFAKGFSATRTRGWPEFSQLEPLITPETRWLDVGCGNGRLWRAFSRGDYLGFDLSEGLLAEARRLSPEATFKHASFTEAWPVNDIDLVVAVASFHHALKKSDQRAFLAEAWRVLRPGGRIWLTTWVLPKKYRWFNWLRGRFRVWNVPFGAEKKPRYYRKTSKRGLERLLTRQGFTDVSVTLSRGRNWVATAVKPL